jgi:hypothetical protein
MAETLRPTPHGPEWHAHHSGCADPFGAFALTVTVGGVAARLFFL